VYIRIFLLFLPPSRSLDSIHFTQKTRRVDFQQLPPRCWGENRSATETAAPQRADSHRKLAFSYHTNRGKFVARAGNGSERAAERENPEQRARFHHGPCDWRHLMGATAVGRVFLDSAGGQR